VATEGCGSTRWNMEGYDGARKSFSLNAGGEGHRFETYRARTNKIKISNGIATAAKHGIAAP
jgi:hypothetical protein